MDPAGPGFEEVQPEVRLDPTDALFVDAIHTDAQHTLDFGRLLFHHQHSPNMTLETYQPKKVTQLNDAKKLNSL